MGQRGGDYEQAKLKKSSGRCSLAFDLEQSVAGQKAEESQQRIGARFLA